MVRKARTRTERGRRAERQELELIVIEEGGREGESILIGGQEGKN